MSGTITARDFRSTMALFATGVTVLSVQTEDGVHGMTANAVTSVSLDPLLVLVCIDKRSRMAEEIKQAEGFGLNILRQEQRALSDYFAGSWEAETPPAFRFVPGEAGPRLEGCLASINCELEKTFEGGDHWVVLGRVVDLHRGIEPLRPLLFYGGRYMQIRTEDPEPAPDLGWVDRPVLVYYDPWRSDT